MRPGLTDPEVKPCLAEFHPEAKRPRDLLVVAAVKQELKCTFNGQAEVLWTGMGRRCAQQAVQRRLRDRSYSLVISTGFAGAARPGLQVGDLVLASEVVDASSGRRLAPCLFPAALEGVSFPHGGCGGATVGRFVTVDKVLSPSEKARMGTQWDALAVEMETAAVAQAAEEVSIPWMAVRAILDPMERSLFGPFFLFGGIRVARERLAVYLKELVVALSFAKPI